jgi:hypothetical protein
MQDQIDSIHSRVQVLEVAQMNDNAQISSIKSDTAELLETFKALKGAWVVLNAVGKLAKPITAIAAIFGLWFSWKSGAGK